MRGSSLRLRASTKPRNIRVSGKLTFASIGVYQSAKLRSEEHTSELQSQSNLVCRPPQSTLFPYTTLFRSTLESPVDAGVEVARVDLVSRAPVGCRRMADAGFVIEVTRFNEAAEHSREREAYLRIDRRVPVCKVEIGRAHV